MKDYLEKRKSTLINEKQKRSTELDEIKARLDALEKTVNESDNEDEQKAASEELDQLKARKEELEAEIAPLQEELDEVNAKIAELDKPADDQEQGQRNKLNFMTKEMRGANKMNLEQRKARAEEFVKTRATKFEGEELRSVLISSGTLATPTEVDGINDNGFPKVSSILDLVKVVNCVGMGSNKVAYEKTGLTATEHTENGAITATDPVFGFVTIQPKEYAVLSSISKQAKKQTPLQYETKVRDAALIALRKVAAKAITDAAVASSLNTALSLTALDQSSLRKIAFNYGGAEGIEGQAYLFLNKTDLITLGDVRGSNEKKAVYEITPNAANPNTGTIKDGGLTVNYCINNNLASGTLLYGQPHNIELDLFSNYDVEVSGDFYFDKLMDAIRGDVQLGADVVCQDGLVKVTVTKAA